MHFTLNIWLLRSTALLVNSHQPSSCQAPDWVRSRACSVYFLTASVALSSEMWWVIRQWADKTMTLPHRLKTFSGVLENIWLSLWFNKWQITACLKPLMIRISEWVRSHWFAEQSSLLAIKILTLQSKNRTWFWM